jgi:hypothetical protein
LRLRSNNVSGQGSKVKVVRCGGENYNVGIVGWIFLDLRAHSLRNVSEREIWIRCSQLSDFDR